MSAGKHVVGDTVHLRRKKIKPTPLKRIAEWFKNKFQKGQL